jgi:hypothetical protein
MVAKESGDARETVTSISTDKPHIVESEIMKLQRLDLPNHHQILPSDLNSSRLKKILLETYERQPKNFEALLGIKGVGPKTIRSLSLISELVYGVKSSFSDPARFSFAHGGKDGHPYPIDRKNYDMSIEFLKESVSMAKIGREDKLNAIRRLNRMVC